MPKLRKDATSGAFSAFRVSEWSVRRKVVAVLALPVMLAAVFGGMRVRTELQSASDYSANQRHATVLGPAIAYLAATERMQLPGNLSKELDAADPTEQYFKAAAALKRAAAGANLSPEQRADVTKVLQIGDSLVTGSGTGITATAPVQLGNMTRTTNELVNSTLDTKGTPDRRSQALISTLNARLSLVKQQLLIQGSSHSASLLDSVWLAAEMGVEGQALQGIKDNGGTGRHLNALIAANTARLGQAASKNAADLAATPGSFNNYDAESAVLLEDIGASLTANADTSRTRALTDSAVILLALIASLILAFLMAGALIKPLRKVRAGAHEVANDKLPETVRKIRNGEEPDEITPIPVNTHEELGQLARAVDDMHRQAVNLATGEAQLRSQVGAMFVTLSRRNTTLVNQQLALIESLEQDEEDPQRLEQLFALDHLATRMRRTAESLVILGGTSGRAASFEELSVSDIVHAAVSEVQDYQRVRIDAAPDRLVAGRAASDVVHLMAELIDNALSYSPPGTPVTIQASAEDGHVDIEVVDSGLGMAGDALAKANESLKRGGEVTIDTARRMGLFVVSRLAEEHGLKVKLRRNTNGGGIIATVTLPAEVLVSDEPVEHVSILDAPEQVVEPQNAVETEPEPDEEYDPYLERIEEAIAAVTGLPRRRPGQNVQGPEPVPTPAAAVSMFDAAPELPAGYEPTPLPGVTESESSSGSEESEAIPMPAPLRLEPSVLDDEVPLADVVTAIFGGDREARDPWATEPVALVEQEAEDALASVEDSEDVEDVEDVEALADPLFGDATFADYAAENTGEAVEADEDESEQVDWPVTSEREEWPAVTPAWEADEADEVDETDLVAADLDEPDVSSAELDEVDEVESEDDVPEPEPVPEPAFAVARPGWLTAARSLDDQHPSEELVSHNAPEETEPAVPAVPWGVPAARIEEPAAPAEEPTPLQPVAEAVAEPVVEPVAQPVAENDHAVRLQIRRPLDATSAASALDGDVVVPTDGEETSPIFGQLRTNWLNEEADTGWSDREVDRGWEAAERSEGGASDTTRGGLPVRRPGGRLVPGGVTPEPTNNVVRDPEAIRNRLAAHAAGVSRGREAAASQPRTDDYAHEETGPA